MEKVPTPDSDSMLVDATSNQWSNWKSSEKLLSVTIRDTSSWLEHSSKFLPGALKSILTSVD